MLLGGQCYVGPLGVLREGTLHSTDLTISRQRQAMVTMPLKQLLQRELQQGQGSHLAVHLKEPRASPQG